MTLTTGARTALRRSPFLSSSSRCGKSQHYKQTNLVSNVAGLAPITDPNLKNPGTHP